MKKCDIGGAAQDVCYCVEEINVFSAFKRTGEPLLPHVVEYEMMCHGPHCDKGRSGRHEALTWRVGSSGESGHVSGIAIRED